MHLKSQPFSTPPSLLVCGSQTAAGLLVPYGSDFFKQDFPQGSCQTLHHPSEPDSIQWTIRYRANRIPTPTKPPRRPANLVCPCICSPRRCSRHAYNIFTCDFKLGRAGFINRNRCSEDICAGRSCFSCRKTLSGVKIAV